MHECPICLDVKDLVSLVCKHKICKECLIMQLKQDARCALCRQIITSCTPKFDAISHEKTITIRVKENGGIGARIYNGVNGVEVLHVYRGSLAEYHGIMKGDVIVSINGLPCTCFKRCIQIIQGCLNCETEFGILPQKKNGKFCCHWS
jgi:hypothetical protein